MRYILTITKKTREKIETRVSLVKIKIKNPWVDKSFKEHLYTLYQWYVYIEDVHLLNCELMTYGQAGSILLPQKEERKNLKSLSTLSKKQINRVILNRMPFRQLTKEPAEEAHLSGWGTLPPSDQRYVHQPEDTVRPHERVWATEKKQCIICVLNARQAARTMRWSCTTPKWHHIVNLGG